MRSRLVIYSVAGVVAMGLIAAAAFKSSQPASESVAVAQPTAAVAHKVANHAQAKAKVAHAAPAKPGPAVNHAVSPLPPSYAVLLSHCLFSSRPTALSAKASRAEGDYTLRGVFQRGRRCIAYVENTTSHQAQELNVGEPIGVGKLTSIDLDGVRFDAPGRNMRVEVGQSFGNARKVASAETSSISTLRQITE